MNRLLKQRCTIIVTEGVVAKVLKVLDNHRLGSKLSIRTPNEATDNRWYISFTASEKQWVGVKTDLKEGHIKASFPTKDSFRRVFDQEL